MHTKFALTGTKNVVSGEYLVSRVDSVTLADCTIIPTINLWLVPNKAFNSTHRAAPWRRG